MQNLDKINKVFDNMFLGDTSKPSKRVSSGQASRTNHVSMAISLGSSASSRQGSVGGSVQPFKSK